MKYWLNNYAVACVVLSVGLFIFAMASVQGGSWLAFVGGVVQSLALVIANRAGQREALR